MPEGSYPFPIYSGLLEPEHYKKIGSAIWLFLWCVSSTTAEREEKGTVWGIVLGNKPMKLSEISERFGVNDKTVSRWLDTLEAHHYIQVTRAPRGLILWVRNSKKKKDKYVRSQPSEQTEMSDHIDDDKTKMSDQLGSEQTNMSDHEQNLASDRTEMSDLKDIKDLTTTPPTTGTEWFEDDNPDPEADGMIAILNAYCKLHSKLDFHVKPREREAMGRMVAGGMPVPFTISTMESLLQAKREREGNTFKMPTSFLYYEDAINEAWQNSQTTSPPMTGVAQGAPTASKRMTKQQRAINDLRRRAEEERRREQSRGY
ncbi:hypothetical protein [Paenibacillus azoreducens]|uniref:Phage-like element PBSX protein XkdB n=1 Tax=Paenibacillus azoreducens TaxID=116718 RepID=A0A920CSC9_9BACL|nr:hypothetical protein [Paenibacillus azoreducens]GIO48009.1 phage-like element PBSX protein XkdB [Paenibacillus azoreducens]